MTNGEQLAEEARLWRIQHGEETGTDLEIGRLREQVKVLQDALHMCMSEGAEIRKRLARAEQHAMKLAEILDHN